VAKILAGVSTTSKNVVVLSSENRRKLKFKDLSSINKYIVYFNPLKLIRSERKITKPYLLPHRKLETYRL